MRRELFQTQEFQGPMGAWNSSSCSGLCALLKRIFYYYSYQHFDAANAPHTLLGTLDFEVFNFQVILIFEVILIFVVVFNLEVYSFFIRTSRLKLSKKKENFKRLQKLAVLKFDWCSYEKYIAFTPKFL